MVKILLATATRISELVCSRWEHVDFEGRTWTIPPENIKGRKTKAARGEQAKSFVIPLSEQVTTWFLELKRLSFESDWVLPIRKRRSDGDRHMESTSLNAAINALCAELGGKCQRFTPHDLRSTARSHLSALGVDLIVAERCLNHNLGGLIAVYDQHDFLSERRAALELWASFLAACETGREWSRPSSYVIPMHRAATQNNQFA